MDSNHIPSPDPADLRAAGIGAKVMTSRNAWEFGPMEDALSVACRVECVVSCRPKPLHARDGVNLAAV